MAENIEQTIRNLEALAARPGTIEEGELARAKAIEKSLKYGIPSVFTQPDYKQPPPVEKQKQRPASKPTKLHHQVVMMEARLKQDNWEYSHFDGNKRVYKWSGRPDEEIHMHAYRFGEFNCQHYYKPTGRYRQAGNNAEELGHFFDSISYRLQLWPSPHYDRPTTTSDFYYPDPPWSDPEPEIVTESAVASVKDIPVSEPEPEVERISVIDEMLSNRVPWYGERR